MPTVEYYSRQIMPLSTTLGRLSEEQRFAWLNQLVGFLLSYLADSKNVSRSSAHLIVPHGYDVKYRSRVYHFLDRGEMRRFSFWRLIRRKAHIVTTGAPSVYTFTVRA